MVNVDPSKALDQRGRGAAGPGRSTASEGATPAKKKVKKVKSSNAASSSAAPVYTYLPVPSAGSGMRAYPGGVGAVSSSSSLYLPSSSASSFNSAATSTDSLGSDSTSTAEPGVRGISSRSPYASRYHQSDSGVGERSRTPQDGKKATKSSKGKGKATTGSASSKSAPSKSTLVAVRNPPRTGVAFDIVDAVMNAGLSQGAPGSGPTTTVSSPPLTTRTMIGPSIASIGEPLARTASANTSNSSTGGTTGTANIGTTRSTTTSSSAPQNTLTFLPMQETRKKKKKKVVKSEDVAARPVTAEASSRPAQSSNLSASRPPAATTLNVLPPVPAVVPSPGRGIAASYAPSASSRRREQVNHTSMTPQQAHAASVSLPINTSGRTAVAATQERPRRPVTERTPEESSGPATTASSEEGSRVARQATLTLADTTQHSQQTSEAPIPTSTSNLSGNDDEPPPPPWSAPLETITLASTPMHAYLSVYHDVPAEPDADIEPEAPRRTVPPVPNSPPPSFRSRSPSPSRAALGEEEMYIADIDPEGIVSVERSYDTASEEGDLSLSSSGASENGPTSEAESFAEDVSDFDLQSRRRKEARRWEAKRRRGATGEERLHSIAKRRRKGKGKQRAETTASEQEQMSLPVEFATGTDGQPVTEQDSPAARATIEVQSNALPASELSAQQQTEAATTSTAPVEPSMTSSGEEPPDEVIAPVNPLPFQSNAFPAQPSPSVNDTLATPASVVKGKDRETSPSPSPRFPSLGTVRRARLKRFESERSNAKSMSSVIESSPTALIAVSTNVQADEQTREPETARPMSQVAKAIQRTFSPIRTTFGGSQSSAAAAEVPVPAETTKEATSPSPKSSRRLSRLFRTVPPASPLASTSNDTGPLKQAQAEGRQDTPEAVSVQTIEILPAATETLDERYQAASTASKDSIVRGAIASTVTPATLKREASVSQETSAAPIPSAGSISPFTTDTEILAEKRSSIENSSSADSSCSAAGQISPETVPVPSTAAIATPSVVPPEVEPSRSVAASSASASRPNSRTTPHATSTSVLPTAGSMRASSVAPTPPGTLSIVRTRPAQVASPKPPPSRQIRETEDTALPVLSLPRAPPRLTSDPLSTDNLRKLSRQSLRTPSIHSAHSASSSSSESSDNGQNALSPIVSGAESSDSDSDSADDESTMRPAASSSVSFPSGVGLPAASNYTSIAEREAAAASWRRAEDGKRYSAILSRPLSIKRKPPPIPARRWGGFWDSGVVQSRVGEVINAVSDEFGGRSAWRTVGESPLPKLQEDEATTSAQWETVGQPGEIRDESPARPYQLPPIPRSAPMNFDDMRAEDNRSKEHKRDASALPPPPLHPYIAAQHVQAESPHPEGIRRPPPPIPRSTRPASIRSIASTSSSGGNVTDQRPSVSPAASGTTLTRSRAMTRRPQSFSHRRSAFIDTPNPPSEGVQPPPVSPPITEATRASLITRPRHVYSTSLPNNAFAAPGSPHRSPVRARRPLPTPPVDISHEDHHNSDSQTRSAAPQPDHPAWTYSAPAMQQSRTAPPASPTREVTDLDVMLSNLDTQEGAEASNQVLQEVLGLTSGATPEEIDSLPVGRVELERRRIDKNGKVRQKLSCVGIGANKCGICLTQFKEDELAVVLPNCLHIFHTEPCMRLYLSTNNLCPTCHTNLM